MLPHRDRETATGAVRLSPRPPSCNQVDFGCWESSLIQMFQRGKWFINQIYLIHLVKTSLPGNFGGGAGKWTEPSVNVTSVNLNSASSILVTWVLTYYNQTARRPKRIARSSIIEDLRSLKYGTGTAWHTMHGLTVRLLGLKAQICRTPTVGPWQSPPNELHVCKRGMTIAPALNGCCFLGVDTCNCAWCTLNSP